MKNHSQLVYTLKKFLNKIVFFVLFFFHREKLRRFWSESDKDNLKKISTYDSFLSFDYEVGSNLTEIIVFIQCYILRQFCQWFRSTTVHTLFLYKIELLHRRLSIWPSHKYINIDSYFLPAVLIILHFLRFSETRLGKRRVEIYTVSQQLVILGFHLWRRSRETFWSTRIYQETSFSR